VITPDHQPKRTSDTAKRLAFDKIIAEIRARFADLPPQQLEPLIEEAVAAARKGPR